MDDDVLYITEYLISAIARILFLHNAKLPIESEDMIALERAFWDLLKILDDQGVKFD